MRRYLPVVIIAFVGLGTVAAGILLYRAEIATLPNAPHDVATPSRLAAHVRGAKEARVTIEEFGDFECPPCGALSEPLNDIERDYRQKVRLIFREYPLPSHQHARTAAVAAEAAGLQGRFWEMHDLLYREQTNWSKSAQPTELFLSYARIVGLDLVRFQKDMGTAGIQERIAADQRRAAELSVRVTPTIFVNGKPVVGPALNPSGLRAAVDAALKEGG